MIKLIWYLVNISIISLILINNPTSINTNNFNSQNKFFSFKSNQLLTEKFILINIIIFIILTTVLSIYI